MINGFDHRALSKIPSRKPRNEARSCAGGGRSCAQHQRRLLWGRRKELLDNAILGSIKWSRTGTARFNYDRGAVVVGHEEG